MLFNHHSLRLAPIEMHSPFSGICGSGKQIQMQLCAELCALRGASLCQALHCMAGSRSIGSLPASVHVVGLSCSSMRRALRVRSAPRKVSQLQLPGPAGKFSAVVCSPCLWWQSRGSSRLQIQGRARACCPTLQSTGLPPAAGYLKR